MLKWIKNLINIENNLPPGKCPYCGSDNTDYRKIKVTLDMGFGDVWCNDCKKAYHISRITVDKEHKVEVDTSSLDFC